MQNGKDALIFIKSNAEFFCCGLNLFMNSNILDCFFHMRTKWDEQKYWVKHDKSLLTNLKIAADKMWAKSVTHRLQLGREWVYLRQTGLLPFNLLFVVWMIGIFAATDMIYTAHEIMLIANCPLPPVLAPWECTCTNRKTNTLTTGSLN